MAERGSTGWLPGSPHRWALELSSLGTPHSPEELPGSFLPQGGVLRAEEPYVTH